MVDEILLNHFRFLGHLAKLWLSASPLIRFLSLLIFLFKNSANPVKLEMSEASKFNEKLSG